VISNKCSCNFVYDLLVKFDIVFAPVLLVIYNIIILSFLVFPSAFLPPCSSPHCTKLSSLLGLGGVPSEIEFGAFYV